MKSRILWGLVPLLAITACSKPTRPPMKYSLVKPKHQWVEVYHETIGHLACGDENSSPAQYGVGGLFTNSLPSQKSLVTKTPEKAVPWYLFTQKTQECCQITAFLPVHLRETLTGLQNKRQLKSTILSPHDMKELTVATTHEITDEVKNHRFSVNIEVPVEEISPKTTPFVFVRLFLGASTQLTVPHDAIYKDREGSFLYVHQRGSPIVKRYVTLGQKEPDFIVVQSGLNRKELVAIAEDT